MAYLLGFDETTHKCSALQVRTRTEAHSNDAHLGHFIEHTLRRPLSIFLASLTIGNDNVLDEFTVGKLEFEVVLRRTCWRQISQHLEKEVRLHTSV